MPRFRAVAAVFALLLIPAVGTTQDAPRTHTVKRGDTLWDLARTYLSDPFLWPEIYRVNTDVIEDPHWIYPGEVLRIPDLAALQRRTTDEVRAQQPPPPARLDPTMGQRPAAPGRVMIPSPSLVLKQAVRSGQYLAAPFIGPEGGPPGAGRIVSGASGSELASSAATGRMMMHMDPVVISPPVGVRAVKGDRFLIYRLGEVFVGRGQVVQPLGTVRVNDAGSANGGQVLAEVDQLFNAVHVGDRLMPLDTLVAREGVFPKAVEPELTVTVLWVEDKVSLPSIGRYVIFNAAALDGVVTGDQVTLIRERPAGTDGERLADHVLGIAQILKVTEQGSSAVILRTTDPGTAVGTLGRVTAKMQ
jgi:hypothetical protein